MAFCGWPVTAPTPPSFTTAEVAAWTAASTEQRDAATTLAGRILWVLTGQVYGLCPLTVRVCHQPPPSSTYSGLRLVPPCGTMCGPGAGTQVELPAPVHEVTEVSVGGTVLDPSAWMVASRRWLRRIDGQPWPYGDDITVTLERGIPIPAGGNLMATRLALNLLAGARGDACSLPDRATSANRQGVSIELADIREWFSNSLTGIETVDLWVMAWNPTKSRHPARIISPDSPRWESR